MKIWIVTIAALISLTAAQENTSVEQVDSAKTAGDQAPAPPVTEPEVKAAAQPEVESGQKPFVPQVELQKQTRTEVVFPQDPKLSAFLSITFPGLGQLYQGNYLKTTLFMGAFLIGSGTITYLANENRKGSKQVFYFNDADTGDKVKLTKYEDLQIGDVSYLNTTEKAVNYGAFGLVAVSYIWSVIDAYRSAKAFNRKNFYSSQSKKLGFRPKTGIDSQGMELVYRF